MTGDKARSMTNNKPALEKMKGRVALITGAARPRGIACSIAGVFAGEGAAVALTDILDQVLERADELQADGHTAVGFTADLTKANEVREMVKKITDQFGKIDILVNVAGRSVPPRPSFVEMSDDYWDMVMDRNLRTTYNCCKAVVPGMIEQKYGKIVNFSSITGPKVVYRYSAAYAAAKGAVSALTKALALELGEYNITANAILPGDIDTADEAWRPQDGPRDLGSLNAHLRPAISRPGRPEEPAHLALFLATDESRFITGVEITIDGGATIVEPFPAEPSF